MREVDIAIIGGGSAGLYALSQAQLTTKNFVLINGGAYGTTCARVGCMPSKVLIQIAEDFHHRHTFDAVGIQGSEHLKADIPAVMRHVRKLRDGFVGKVIKNKVDRLIDKRIDGYAGFVEPNVLKVGEEYVRAKKIIIATGSKPFIPRAWEKFQDYILTTDDLFEQEDLPANMAVLGLGVIGLELGQALHRLGINITGVDLLESIGGIQDPIVNQKALDIIGQEMPLLLGYPAELEEKNGKLVIHSGENSIVVDKVLASLGRIPNLSQLGLENLDVELDERGMPTFNPHTMQIGDLPIFIVGDANGERPILHEAADEGRIAGFNAGRDEVQAFKRKTSLSVTFCDPNIVRVGAAWSELKDNPNVAIGEAGLTGRAMIMGKNQGIIRIYGDKTTGLLLGAEMVAIRGEHLGHLLAMAIQQGMTVIDFMKIPFYHPVLEESLQNALYNLYSKMNKLVKDTLLELDQL